MGKGDIKTKKGKISNGSFGTTRLKKPVKKTAAPEKTEKPKAEAPKAEAAKTEKPKAEKPKAAKK